MPRHRDFGLHSARALDDTREAHAGTVRPDKLAILGGHRPPQARRFWGVLEPGRGVHGGHQLHHGVATIEPVAHVRPVLRLPREPRQ